MPKTNYIICTHNDLDGFCCGAILLNEFPYATISFGTSKSIHRKMYYIRKYLSDNSKNYLFICDISPKAGNISKINKIISDFKTNFNLQVIWFDHHQWPNNAKILKGIEIIHDDKKKSAANLVQKYVDQTTFSYFSKLAEWLPVEDAEYWKTVIRNAGKIPLSDERLKRLLHYFSKLKQSELTEEFYKSSQKLTSKELDSISLFDTIDGKRFAILDLRKIFHDIDYYAEKKRITKTYSCDFVCIIKRKNGISIYNENEVDLSFLKELGVEGHVKTGAIVIPRPYINWPNSKFHRPLIEEELIDILIEKKIKNLDYEGQQRTSHYHKDEITQLKELPSMDSDLFNLLNENNIKNVSDLSNCETYLLEDLDISKDLAKCLIREAEASLERNRSWSTDGFGRPNLKFKENQKYFDILWEFNKGWTMTSGCQSLDAFLLSDGFKTKDIYEFYGLSKVGKTYLIHQLLCRGVLPLEQGGLGGMAIYFDTEHNFNKDIIRAIAPRFNLEPEYVFQNMARRETVSTNDLLSGVERELPKFIKRYEVRLIIVDNLIEHFLTEYPNPDNPERGNKIARVFDTLKAISRNFNVVVIYTNHIVSLQTDYQRIMDIEHTGGVLLNPNVRIKIQFVYDEIDIREFYISNEKPCVLSISSDGFHDV